MDKTSIFSFLCSLLMFSGCATDPSGEPRDLFKGIAGKKYAASVHMETETAEGKRGIDVSVSCKESVTVTFSANDYANKKYKYKIGNATGRYILKEGSGKISKKSWSLSVNVDEAQKGHTYAASIEIPSADDYDRSYTSCP